MQQPQDNKNTASFYGYKHYPDFRAYPQSPFGRSNAPGGGGGIFRAVVAFGFVMLVLAASPLMFIMLGPLAGSNLLEFMLLVAVIIMAATSNMRFKEVFPTRKTSIRWCVASVLTWFGAASLANMLNMFCHAFLVRYWPERLSDQLSGSGGDPYESFSFIMLVITIAVFPAVCEEFVSRGFIQYNLREYPPWFGIVFTGALFGLMHFSHLSVISVIVTGIMGIGLCYIMYRTGSIILPIIMHFINNFITVLPYALPAVEAGEEIAYELTPAFVQTMWPLFLTIGCIVGFLFPVFLLIGDVLYAPPRPFKVSWMRGRKKRAIAGISLSVVLLFGVVISLVLFMDQLTNLSDMPEFFSLTLRILRIAVFPGP